jgi:hypothetical protein
MVLIVWHVSIPVTSLSYFIKEDGCKSKIFIFDFLIDAFVPADLSVTKKDHVRIMV